LQFFPFTTSDLDFSHLSSQLSSSPLTALPVLFIAGVLTSLAPCIYPMIPITAAIVGGTSIGDSPRARSRTVLLTLTYVVGLALAPSGDLTMVDVNEHVVLQAR